MANQKGSRQLKHNDRIRLEALYNAGHKVVEIAEILHVHRSTIYNELKRGQYEHLNSDYTREMRYSAEPVLFLRSAHILIYHLDQN